MFSDGGNFCPEEIDVYRKKLENMSSKIDVSEGAIMSDMEDIEKKRLDQATKVASEFEDRYDIEIIIHTHSYIIIQGLGYISVPVCTNIIFKLYAPCTIQARHNKAVPV